MSGLFNLLGDDDIAKTDKQKKSEKDIKQEEVRKTSGFDSIGAVAAAAPSSYAESSGQVSSPSSSQSYRKTSSATSTKAAKEAAAAAEKEAKRQKAIETFGKRYCKMAAEMPYDVWARIMGYDFLKLTEEQAQSLAEEYYEFIEIIKPDFTSPWTMLAALGIHNAILVGERVKMVNDANEKKKKQSLEPSEKIQ